MTHIVPAPGLSLALLVVWLLLNDSIQPGQLLLGIALALLVPWAVGARRRRPWGMPRAVILLALIARVGADIVRSNLELAVRILGPESTLRPTYVWVPVSLDRPAAVSVLASIITLTPGTVSADVANNGRALLVHAFDADDEAALVQQIKTRYEAPLARLFQ